MDFDDNVEEMGEGVGELNINEDILLMEEETNTQYKTLKDSVIFLVDCNKSMLDNNAINKVLLVAESFLKTKIITNEKDIFGLILYNTEQTVNNFNFEGINVKIPLSPPNAAIIKHLKELQQCTNPSNDNNYLQNLRDIFPNSKVEISLATALTVCHSELKNFDEKAYNKRIFLFTDNDNPMNGNFTDRNITIQRAKDMLESEIIIELFPMNFNTSFNMKKFFYDIIPRPEDSNEDLVLTRENCEDRLRELTKRIRQKEVKKRNIGKCNFYLTKDVKFMVNFYATLKKTNKPRSYNVDARTNKSLNTISQFICKDTAGILYQNQIGTYQTYGGSKIPFTKEEMKQIKTFDNPGIKLMGFKSFDSIKPYYNIRESYFLYPDEYLTHGASQLCDALIKQMTSKNKVAIVKFIPREGANIRFCALVPQKETFDEDYFQTPPGFNLIFLPYADEIRSSEDILKKHKFKQGSVSKEESEAAKKLIKKMNIDFDSRNFENPSIQKFYATLQALALGEQDIEQVEDYLNPNNEALSKVLNGCDVDFKDTFFGESANRSYVPVRKEKKSRAVKEEGGNVGAKKRNVGVKRSASEESEKKHTPKKKGKSKMFSDDEESSSMDHDGPVKKRGKSRSKTPAKSAAKKSKVIKEEDEEIYAEDDNVKMEDEFGDNNKYSNEKLLSQLEEGNLNSYTVKELKIICAEKNIKLSGKANKGDILVSLQDYLFSHMK